MLSRFSPSLRSCTQATVRRCGSSVGGTARVPTFHDPISNDEEVKALAPSELEKLANYKNERTRILTRRSTKPKSFTDFAIGDNEPLPENPSELAALSGMPAVHQNRTVVIANRYNSAMQSGGAYEHQWQITWKISENWTNPITGYTSGADPMSSVKLHFDSKEEAIQYADRYGWKYEVGSEVSADITEAGWREYGDNFLPQTVQRDLEENKTDTTHFHQEGLGASHWFMPLKFHGDGEVRQHGGE